MTEIASSAIDLIGNTPLLALDRIWPGPGRLLAKCEFLNPGASIKDRSSLYMIKKARELGKLKPRGAVVEVTSGNQGCGLAVVCSVLGHPLTLTMSKGNSPQRAQMMAGLGAKCLMVDQVTGTPGHSTGEDVLMARAKAIEVAEKTKSFYVNQFNNEANCLAHYETTAPEIWRQAGGKVDAFVSVIGTAGTFAGITRFLREKNPKLHAAVVEPKGSEPIKGRPITKKKHLIQGSGYGFVPNLFNYETLSESIAVSDREAVKYKELLGSKEGLYLGYSSGANVAGAVRLLQSGILGPDAVVVTILVDSGLKYPMAESYAFEDEATLDRNGNYLALKEPATAKKQQVIGYRSESNEKRVAYESKPLVTRC